MFQLIFENGEGPDEIRRSIEKKNPAMTVKRIRDLDLESVWPTESENSDDNPPEKLKKGEFDEKRLDFKFDRIAVVYLHPDAPEIDCVYYIETHR